MQGLVNVAMFFFFCFFFCLFVCFWVFFFFFFFFFVFFFFCFFVFCFVSIVLYYTILEPSQEILALFVPRINTLQIRILGNQVGLDD